MASIFEYEPYIRKVLFRDEPMPDGYPFNLPVVKALAGFEPHPHVTMFVGENGTGKSTILEAIAVAWGFNAEGGSKSFNFSTNSTHSDLYDYIYFKKGHSLPESEFFLRAESFYNVATEVDRLGVSQYYGGKSLHKQSHGEAFLTLFFRRFRRPGLYILDEPEAALSPLRQLAIVRRIHELANIGCQFIIATHSPLILAYPDADIYELSDTGFQKRRYEELEHVIVTRDFLNRPEQGLRHLMSD